MALFITFTQGDTQKCCLRGICIAYIPSYVLAIITFGIRIVWQYTIMTNTKLNLVTWQVTWLFCFRCLLHSLFVYSLLALASMGSRGGSKWKSQLRNGKPGILPLLHLPPAINTKIFRQLVFSDIEYKILFLQVTRNVFHIFCNGNL